MNLLMTKKADHKELTHLNYGGNIMLKAKIENVIQSVLKAVALAMGYVGNWTCLFGRHTVFQEGRMTIYSL